ncbi:unnamed protein product [Phytomonas sp. Hart1]|nr:unnamed protein product [Phytomonas sp. Hart1]|eukprot:CCW69566.1 unnamed protein product [Phytomonas sp. isolate Hart1]
MRRGDAGAPRCPADVALGQMLAGIQQELLRRYGQPREWSILRRLAPGEEGRREKSQKRGREGDALVHLTPDDWACALHPMAELGPYLASTSAPSSERRDGGELRSLAGTSPQSAPEGLAVERTSIDRGDGDAPPETPGATANDRLTSSPLDSAVVVNYVKCRCAELPMRLRLEALQMRRHEHLLRQHMQELIRLSEFLALCGAVPSGTTWETPTGGLADSSHAGTAKASFGQFEKSSPPPGHMDLAKRDGVEGLQLLSRCFQRVAELERLVESDSMNKVLCAERMVLLSATTLAAARRVDLNT